MKHIKRVTILGLFVSLVLAFLFGGTGQASVREIQSEPSVLARVEVRGLVDDLGLPVYAHLQDAAGDDYALVIAPLSLLDEAGAYTVLDAQMDGTPYLIALERRPGARQQAGQVVNVLHDDGRRIIARAAPEDAGPLAEMGFEIRLLDDTPMVLGRPARLAAEALTAEYDPAIAGMIAQVEQNTVYVYDGNLSGEWPVSIGGSDYTITSRYTRSGTPMTKATQYVYEFMQGLGLAVSYHDWTYSTTSNRNVVGEQVGTTSPGEIILITAHLDDMPSSGLAPGADDNASGSVGVMVSAEILSQYDFERTIRYVFFTGEEQGLYGSKRYADLVYGASENIVAVYNMDMIAWDDVGGPTLRLHTRTTGSSGYAGDLAIANVFVDVVNDYGLALTPIIDADGITASDHSSFWNKGYSALLAIEDDDDDFCDYYHTSNDTLSTLNMTYFTNYTKASVGTAAHLALFDDGVPSTPTPTPDPTATMHVGDLDGSSAPEPKNRWGATVSITVHDYAEGVLANATVEGSWSGGATGSGSCVTDGSGQCSVSKSGLKSNVSSVTFSVNSVTHASKNYAPGANHDPDGDSDGNSIIVYKEGPPTPTPTPTATPTPGPSVVMHVGDLDASSAPAPKNRWGATVSISVHDESHNPVVNATVDGSWSGGASGGASCTTDGAGQCSVAKGNLKSNVSSVTFTVSNVTLAGSTYDGGANHDPDGDSDGTSIIVLKP